MQKRVIKWATLFTIGSLLYFEIELNWRYVVGHLPVHWSMPIVGGMLFVVLGGINEVFSWDMPLVLQGIIGAIVCTASEFAVGCIVNIGLGLHVWDYSHVPFNLKGQVCLPFALAWFALSVIAVVLDDWLRYKLFGEEKPHYVIFWRKKRK